MLTEKFRTRDLLNANWEDFCEAFVRFIFDDDSELFEREEGRMHKVLLNTIEKVKAFVDIVSKFDCDVTLHSGKYSVDAKSVLGIFSFNLTDPMLLEFEGAGENESIYLEQLKDFLYKEG